MSSVALQYEDFDKVYKRTKYNDILSLYYERLYDETNEDTHYNRINSVDLCGKYFDFDYYRFQAVKALTRMNLCRDKFCPNCQSLLATRRLFKYQPYLDSYAKDNGLYHVVFTVPNCTDVDLKVMVSLMYKTFGHVMRYLRGNLKIKGIDFTQYGWLGCIRSLEVTQNHENGTFHPHFHCIFIMKKDLVFDKVHKNQYSYDGRKLVRLFSDFEILLQKIWYLCFTGVRCTLKEIENLKQGFSVIVDECKPGDYKEVFKYAVKGCFKGDEIFTYESFKTLYYALHSRRVIQGYGVLRVLDFENDDIIEDEIDDVYDKYISKLAAFESPVKKIETLSEVLTETLNGNYIYVSKSSFRRVLLDTA